MRHHELLIIAHKCVHVDAHRTRNRCVARMMRRVRGHNIWTVPIIIRPQSIPFVYIDKLTTHICATRIWLNAAACSTHIGHMYYICWSVCLFIGVRTKNVIYFCVHAKGVHDTTSVSVLMTLHMWPTRERRAQTNWRKEWHYINIYLYTQIQIKSLR